MRKALRNNRAVVYRITNLLNGKFYIGVTTHTLRLRLTQHFAAATQTKKNLQGHFQRAIRKYGRDAFVIELLLECETAEIALREEMRLIAELKPHYNSTLGGDGSAGHVLSDEAKAKIGAVHKGNTYRLGKRHTQEVREILREHGHARKELFSTFQHLGPEASARPVICLNDNSEYPSASAAAKAHGLPKSLVIEVCLRNPRRATARGIVFRYVDDVLDAQAELATAMKRTKSKYKMVL